MTALANDQGYEDVFSAQLNNLLEPDDLVIAISSSGNSPNIIKALKLANARSAKTWTWVGFDGGEAQEVSKRHIYIPSKKRSVRIYGRRIFSDNSHAFSVFSRTGSRFPRYCIGIDAFRRKKRILNQPSYRVDLFGRGNRPSAVLAYLCL